MYLRSAVLPHAAGTIPLSREVQANNVRPISEISRYDVQNPIYLGVNASNHTRRPASANSRSGMGGNPAAPLTPAQHASASGGGVRDYGVGGEPNQTDNDIGVIEPELRWRMWILFAVEKLASTTCIAFEIYTLDVCFDENIWDDQTSLETTEVAELLDYEAKRTYYIVLFTLIFGLVVEIVSAVVLSCIYGSPLDIKSVHRIPPNDLRNCGGNLMVFFLAPFSWAVIYLIGGIASVLYGIHASCSGHGGQGLDVYLAVSGFFMLIVGFGLLVTSVFILFFAFGSPSRCTDGCCATARRVISKRILSKGAWFEIFWILQGVVWSYRTGDPTTTILGVMIVSLGLVVFCAGGRVAVRSVFPQSESK